MELNVKTKFDIGDILYRLIDNNIRKFKINALRIVAICTKGDNNLRYQTSPEIIYSLNILRLDGILYESYSQVTEDELDLRYFKSKEELVGDMLKNCNV
jgi:hypothetical protein